MPVMLFRFLTVVSLVGSMYGMMEDSAVVNDHHLRAANDVDVPASSFLGKRMLANARTLNNNNNDDGIDYSWVADYSIRFDSCHTLLEFRADAAGGSADGEYDGPPTESLRLVKFKLCPTADGCHSSCRHGAEYLVEMREFVESYLDFQLTQKEYNCEQVEENCDCENANDDQACLSNCYAAAGLDYCEDNGNDNEQNNYNGNDFEIDRYLECERLDDGNDDGYYSSPLYVGAYCSKSGKAIYLGTFSDRSCTQHTSTDNFKTLTGYELPYTSESIVTNDCISCQEPSQYDDDYNADQEDEDAVVEICEELYQRSAKCEGSLQGVEQVHTGGCEYMNKFLPRAERLAKGGANKAKVWAWMFGISTVLLACHAFFLYRRVLRNKVNLSTQ